MDWLDRWRGVTWDPPGDAGWLFVLLALAGFAYAIAVYRRTDAPLSPALRTGLALLRGSVFLVLLLILCRPVLSLAVPGGAARGVLVLLDRSQSMNLPGGGEEDGTRDDQLQRAAVRIETELGSTYPLVFRGFAVGPGSMIEELPAPPADGDATDLALALERGLAEGGPEGRPGVVILVSDGAQTEGSDPISPARRLGVPVQTVALGSPDPVADLALTRVRVNHEAFAGERTPVEAVLRLQGLSGQPVEVQLVDVTEPGSEVELARATRTVTPEGAEQRVSLSFTPEETGLRFLEIRVPGLPGEATLDNNRRLISIRVREEKTGVLILSGTLTWDHTFLRRALAADSTLNVNAGVWRGGRFRPSTPRGTLPTLNAEGLADTRVIVLDHVTPAQLGPGTLETLTGYIRGGGGLLLLTGSGPGTVTQWTGSTLEPALPITATGGTRPETVPVRLTPEGRRHALFDPSVPGAPPLDAWADLPPVAAAPDLGSLKAHAEALMAISGEDGAPILAWSRFGQGNVLMVAAGGIWKWEFISSSLGSGGQVLPPWWRRVAHWLARPGVETQLDIHPEEDVVSRGKAVTFVARVLDDTFQPVPGARVDVTVLPATGAGEEPHTVALAGAEGFFSGSLAGLPPGRYRYEGRARTEGGELGVVDGVIAVDSLGTEMERLEADHELLERIAAVSGGRLWTPGDLDSLSETLSLIAEDEEERLQVAVWDHPLVFVLVVVFASLEWFLRRRRGLV